MEKNSVNEIIMKIFETILKVQVQNRRKRSEFAEWDSLKHIDIIFSIEDEFDIQFTPSEMSELSTIDMAIELVTEKTNKTQK